MSKQRDFWKTKATIHISLTERELYLLDLLAKETNKHKSVIVQEALNKIKEFRELKKEFENNKKDCF